MKRLTDNPTARAAVTSRSDGALTSVFPQKVETNLSIHGRLP